MVATGQFPEGTPHFCDVCQKRSRILTSADTGDSVCPHCGVLVWPSAHRRSLLLYHTQYGPVYLCESPNSGRRARLLLVDVNTADTDPVGMRFVREASRLTKIKHPNLTRVLSVGVVNEQPYALMEFRKAESLEQCLNRVKKLSIGDAVNIAIQCTAALSCLHENNCVHRGVNPTAVSVGADGIVQLTFWPETNVLQVQTRDRYAANFAPEQLRGSPPISARTDVYSLGVLLHQLLADDPSLQHASPMERLMHHLEEGLSPLSELDSSIPQKLSDVVLSALAKDPADRIDIQTFGSRLVALGLAAERLGFLT